MADRAAVSKPSLLNATPQLFVAGIAAASAFFTGKLGFAIDFTYGEPAFYAQVTRDRASLALRHVDRPALDRIASAMKADLDMLSASISVDD